MFGKKKSTAEEEELKIPMDVPKAVEEILIACNENEFEVYKEIANEIGFRPGKIIQEELMHFLKKEDLKIYKHEEVKEFLDEMYGKTAHGNIGATKERPGWNWRHMLKDQGELNNNLSWKISGCINKGLYHEQIPLDALHLVSKLKKVIPELRFFISSVALPEPDPFLMVTCEGMDEVVIMHWDEPNFKS